MKNNLDFAPNKRRKEDTDLVNAWWHWIRPYWHVATFLIIITFIGATQWTNQQAIAAANSKDIAFHEKRLSALEIWQATTAPDIAAIKQEVHDIHEAIIKK